MLHPLDVGDMQAFHLGHLAPRPHGDGMGNKVDDGVVELNVGGHEMFANPSSSLLVISNLVYNIVELNLMGANGDLHDGSTSNYESCQPPL